MKKTMFENIGSNLNEERKESKSNLQKQKIH
jgi:hypothetical protein